jgi:hypothetical protein
LVSTTPRPLYPPGKTRYPLYRRLGGPQGRYRRVLKISPPPGCSILLSAKLNFIDLADLVYLTLGLWSKNFYGTGYIFHQVSQYLEAFVEIYLRVGHGRIVPHPLRFIMIIISYLSYWVNKSTVSKFD